MNHYYKAVRPDGTDFRTGTVDYASLSLTGGKLPRLPGGECCTDGVYHAADVPPTCRPKPSSVAAGRAGSLSSRVSPSRRKATSSASER